MFAAKREDPEDEEIARQIRGLWRMRLSNRLACSYYNIGSPHPELSETQKKVTSLGLDYGMRDRILEIKKRHTFLYYTLTRHGFDMDSAAS
jgi:hypothetical protein